MKNEVKENINYHLCDDIKKLIIYQMELKFTVCADMIYKTICG